MREIKFRAWRRDTQQMFSDIQFADFAGETIVHEQSLNGGIEIAQNTFFDLMQYTGLKDKNGKEIYEGDIVIGDDGVVMSVIFFDGRFELEKDGWPNEPFADGMERIIGNIYENPNLLKT